MSIECISNFLTSPFYKISLDQAEKSEDTSWKVHALVILGRGLQLVAVVFTACSLACSWMISPMYSIGLIPALGCAILRTKCSSAKQNPHGHLFIPGVLRAPFISGQPVGIRNEACNCWINALMQLSLHVPSFEAALRSLPAPFESVKTFIQNYRSSQDQQDFISSANSQTIRECLHQSSNQVISKKPGTQEDASEGLCFLFNHADLSNNPLRNVIESHQNGIVTHAEYLVPLDPVGMHSSRCFVDLLRSYFHFSNSSGNGRRFFQTLPQEICFQCNRFAKQGEQFVKIQDSLPIEETFNLPAEYVKTQQTGEYVCDAFIEHIGSTLSGGHYVAYVKGAANSWWRCSDSQVDPISATEAQQKMRVGYLYHYVKK